MQEVKVAGAGYHLITEIPWVQPGQTDKELCPVQYGAVQGSSEFFSAVK